MYILWTTITITQKKKQDKDTTRQNLITWQVWYIFDISSMNIMLRPCLEYMLNFREIYTYTYINIYSICWTLIESYQQVKYKTKKKKDFYN